jgi:predicted dehydrogenase
MSKIRLGIIGASDIAFRRFLPSLKQNQEFEYVGVASRNIKNTERFVQEYGGKGFGSYDELIMSDEVNALYIPLPPALHFEWAKKSLKNNKHVFLEKPFTTTLKESTDLIELAQQKNLVLHENYMFQYHSQLKTIIKMLKEQAIGELRQIRIAFGFPIRSSNDFRYNKELGGGALLDCGGYTVKLATLLLGDSVKIVASTLNYEKQFNVDFFGSATLINNKKITAQIAFGMDNSYKCELEIWGSIGCIRAPRIFTASTDFNPEIHCELRNDKKVIKLDADDQFLNSITYFGECMNSHIIRKEAYKNIIQQAKLMEKIKEVN